MEYYSANYRKFVIEAILTGLGYAALGNLFFVYAIRVGVSDTQLGWITALPPIIMLIFVNFSLAWRRQYKDTVRSVFWLMMGSRSGPLLVTFTPLFPQDLRTWWLLVCVCVPTFGAALHSSIGSALFKEAVGHDRAVNLISAHNFVSFMLQSFSVFIFGLWLELAPFDMNYQVMFLTCYALLLLGILQVQRVKVEPTPVRDKKLTLAQLTEPLRSGSFRRILVSTVLIYLCYMILLPLVPLHLVNNLGAGEGFIGTFSAVELLACGAGSLLAGRVAQKQGTRVVVSGALLLLSSSAVVLAVAPFLELTLLTALLRGLGWSSIMVGLYGMIVDNTVEIPDQDMPAYFSVYLQATWITSFAAPLIGTQLVASGLTLPTVILIAAFARILVSGFVIWPEERLRNAALRPFTRDQT